MAASLAFVAMLPETTSEQLEKIVNWAKTTCERHIVVESGAGAVLACVRKGPPKNAREHQRLLLSNFRKWGVAQTRRRIGWLTVIDPESFESCASSCAQGGGPHSREPKQSTQVCRANSAPAVTASASTAGVHLLELSLDFDHRARALFNQHKLGDAPEAKPCYA